MRRVVVWDCGVPGEKLSRGLNSNGGVTVGPVTPPFSFKWCVIVGSSSVVRVNDPQDPRLAAYADLRHRSTRPDDGFFVAEGRLVVDELITSRYRLDSLLLDETLVEEFAPKVPDGVPIYAVSKSRIREIVGFDFHRGVLACGVREPLGSFASFMAEPEDSSSDSPRVTLAPIGVSEATNLGVILRTAAGFGIDRVLLGPATCDPFSRRVIRTSMAAVFKARFYRLDDPSTQLRELSGRGRIRTVATTLRDDATPIERFPTGDRDVVLLLGSEAKGLSRDIEDAATDRVTIPMRLGVDSLNVNVAAAIFLYELTRGKMTRGATPMTESRHG